ncbi:MAG TPA: ATP-binding protein [Acetomicrobium flavidum]|uniref:sensor histidine kinase n=1 Tax=Acetomicrobium flavidum TaxID=49896 RepID=UPI002C1487F5|nr:ATP-binding protein [Acetomicrobium flavidum]
MRSIKGRIILFTILLVLISVGSSWYLASKTCEDLLLRRSIDDQGKLANSLEEALKELKRPEAVSFLSKNKGLIEDRILLYDTTGRAMWDSKPDEAKIEYLLGNLEFQEALRGTEVTKYIYNENSGYYTVNFFKKIALQDGDVVITLSRTLGEISAVRQKLSLYFFMLMLFVLCLATFFGHLIVRRILHPLGELSSVAENLALGKPARFSLVGPPEISNLARSLKEMAENLQHALENLSQQRNDLKQLIDLLPAGVILIDNEGRVRYINESAINSLDMPQGDYTGKPFIGVAGISKLMELYDTLRISPEASVEITTSKNKYLNCKGRRISKGFLLLITDMTEQRQLELARRNFMADASHEFQTPLTVIRASAEIIMDNPELPQEEQRELLKKIVNQQERLSKLVDDLLYLAKLEAQPNKSMMQKRQIVDLAQLLREIVDEYRDYPQARKISWNVVIEPESANVLASPEELKKAIGNVIDNALKFTRQKYEDEDGGFISVSLIDGHTHWRIQISDNGVGISEDMTEGIYERFQRGSVSLKGRRKTIGYGLGLAITKNIIEAHGGLIELTSKAEPTTFTISLPKLPEKNRD